MSKTARDVAGYSYTQKDNLFFDANIWLLLYGPQYSANDRRVRVYSEAFKKICEAKCSIFIDVLVLSEFVNSFARFRFNVLKERINVSEFKSFRKSAEFKPIAREIAGACRKILELCRLTESNFEKLNTENLLTEYEDGKADLNDQILGRLCKSKGFKLVTDDADFKGHDFVLLTANSKLLKLSSKGSRP